MSKKAWIAGWMLSTLLCLSGLAWADGVAEVLFLSGKSQWSADGVQAQALKQGTRLAEGTRIETGEDGYVYLGTMDRGFLVLRPRTVARIARYKTDTVGRVEIRLELEKGVARVVSGKAAQAQPQGFRMETPLAVIGVRGTDFSVLAGEELTQVSVRAGGVIVSPLSDECRLGGSGPCSGGQAAELYSHHQGQLIEVRRGATQAIRLAPAAGAGPDNIAPPASEENRQLERNRSSNGAVAVPTKLAETKAENNITAAINVPATPPAPPAPPAPALPEPPVVVQPPVPVEPPVVVVEPPAPAVPSIFWGRWAGVGKSDAEAYSALTDQGRRETIAMNSWFVVTRSRELPTLPRDGSVSLSLAEAQAVIVTPKGVTPAEVTGGSLTLDFGQARFQTSLATQGGGYTSALRAAGPINKDGTFDSLWLAGSNGTVRGTIATDAQQAAYLFQQSLTGGVQVTGVTSWVR